MSEWLAALAATGASTLVAAAANEVWSQARAGFIHLFHRAGRKQEIVTQWVDRTAVALGHAPPEERDAVQRKLIADWSMRLTDLLEESPDLKTDLRELVHRVQQDLPASHQELANSFIASGHASQYNAPNGQITVHHHSGTGSYSQ